MTRALIVLLTLLLLVPGCSAPADRDPADAFIAQMDAAPPDRRVPDWDRTRARMIRPAPPVGDPAPDFTLPQRDGTGDITLSQFSRGRPTVLIFGSFT